LEPWKVMPWQRGRLEHVVSAAARVVFCGSMTSLPAPMAPGA